MARGIIFDRKGSAAAEMALVLPLLMTLLLGSAELGNYLYNEHLLQKAVRDGARYASRQAYDNFDCATGTVDSAVTDNVEELVRTSLLSGGTDRLPDLDSATYTMTAACYSTADDDAGTTLNMAGIYTGNGNGAPVLTLDVNVPYTSVIGTTFGFSGRGFDLNASAQAAVMGI